VFDGGRFGCLTGVSTVFWDLDIVGVLIYGFVRALLYTACVRRGTLCFLIKLFFTYKKIKNKK
jgi:hypothetical protein